ncbi:hypothetical protein [Xanthomonas sacchari]|uniref:hypothetical protein n=1 Tax=Xanthomonas sacchari TaxID=56458 RepID=UPI0011109A91|nr:hypothetical protein [Xanthomonas sacchari]MDV0438399.1 hypothetical protein [Xanthomonas sacchari]
MNLKGIDFFFKDEFWFAIVSGKKFKLEKVYDYKSIVKLLELEFSKVNAVLGPDFNYKNIILSAFKYDSAYWDELALRWLENKSVALDEDIRSALKEKLDHGWFNQHNGHVALRLLKKSSHKF